MSWHQPISVTAKIGHFFNIKNQEPTTPERTKHYRQKICSKHQGKDIRLCSKSNVSEAKLGPPALETSANNFNTQGKK